RSSPLAVSADIRGSMSTHEVIPVEDKSLVYAKPSRCSSKTRTPMPRSPRAMTDSIAPALISTEPDWASRRNTSPVATPPDFKVFRAASTVASLLSRSLMAQTRLAGGRGDRGGRGGGGGGGGGGWGGAAGPPGPGRGRGRKQATRREGRVGRPRAPEPG